MSNNGRPKSAVERFVGGLHSFLPPPEIDEGVLQGLVNPLKATLGGGSFQTDTSGRYAGRAYVVGALLFLISALYKRFTRDRADRIADMLVKKSLDYVDPELFVAKNLNISEPVVVVTAPGDIKRFKAAMQKAGISKEAAAVHVTEIKNELPSEGNATVIPLAGTVSNMFVIVAPKKVPRLMLAHELGHIKSAMMGGRPLSFDVSDQKYKIAEFISKISKLYDERSRMGTVAEEEAAWELAGIPKDNPWRKAAVETYRSHNAMMRALMRLGTLATVPIVAATVLALKSKGGPK